MYQQIKANNIFPFVTKIAYFEIALLSPALIIFPPPLFANGNIISSSFSKTNKSFPLHFLVSLFYILVAYFPNPFKPDQTMLCTVFSSLSYHSIET